jgi:hypothetical protein
MPYFHSATFALNVPPNFIVSSLIFAFVSDTEDGAKNDFSAIYKFDFIAIADFFLEFLDCR